MLGAGDRNISETQFCFQNILNLEREIFMQGK